MAKEKKFLWLILLGFLMLLGISVTSHYNYLLFHTLGEMFALVVALGSFTLLWNTCRFVINDCLSFQRIGLINAVARQLEQIKFRGN